MSEIVFVYADDWEGVYLNGELIQQHHSIDAYDLIHRLIKVGVTLGSSSCVTSVEAGEWLSDEGCLPDTYEEFEEKQND